MDFQIVKDNSDRDEHRILKKSIIDKLNRELGQKSNNTIYNIHRTAVSFIAVGGGPKFVHKYAKPVCMTESLKAVQDKNPESNIPKLNSSSKIQSNSMIKGG